MTKVKYLASYMNGYPFAPTDWEDGGKPIVRIQNLTDPEASWNTTTLDVPQCYTVEAGDILISWSASLGVYVWEREPALLNQHIFKAIPTKEVERRYFVWAAKWFVGELQSQAHGSTMQHLTKDVFGGFAVPLPPKAEQTRIANFLDEQTARIDALIAEKERLIERLEEYRQAWLSWLLESPRGSIKTRLKFCLATSLQYGATESGDVDAVGPRYIRITDIGEDGSLSDDSVKFLTEEQASAYLLDDGDVLFARSGATVGKSFIYRSCVGRAAFAGYLIRARLDQRKLLPEYLALLTETHKYWAYLREEETQSTIQNASADKYANFPIALPSISEQSAYLAQIRPTLDNIVRLVFHTTSHVALLSEYRASLISAAVTGQLDVDGFKSGLS